MSSDPYPKTPLHACALPRAGVKLGHPHLASEGPGRALSSSLGDVTISESVAMTIEEATLPILHASHLLLAASGGFST